MLKTKISVYQGHSTHQIIIVIPFLPPVVDCLPLEKGFQKGGGGLGGYSLIRAIRGRAAG